MKIMTGRYLRFGNVVQVLVDARLGDMHFHR